MRPLRINRFRYLAGHLLVVVLVVQLASASADQDSPEWPAWADDAEDELGARIAAVNEGELEFLVEQPNRAVHHHGSRILISPRSLVDGWVTLEQCHDNLDRVAAVQILFNSARTRALEVVSFRNMDAAYAEANRVELRGIHPDSQVCLRAESQALRRLEAGVFELRNGPFMRRFLDGYYPLQLSLQIDYPDSLTLVNFTPQAQAGFAVTLVPGRVSLEALFEGQLHTRFRFLGE